MTKASRQSKYETHVVPYLDRIPNWRKQGLTEKQVAQKLGIAYSTLTLYRDSHSALSVALKKGKEELVEELENSLYKKAMGFEYEEIETWIEEVDGVQKKRVKKIKRRALPDTGALCFALKNLASDKWRDRQDAEQLGERYIVNIEPPPRPEGKKE